MRLVGQKVRQQQPPRKGDDPRNRVFAARHDMQRHHRALAEPQHDHLFGQKVFVHHDPVQKSIKIGRRMLQAGLAFFLA